MRVLKKWRSWTPLLGISWLHVWTLELVCPFLYLLILFCPFPLQVIGLRFPGVLFLNPNCEIPTFNFQMFALPTLVEKISTQTRKWLLPPLPTTVENQIRSSALELHLSFLTKASCRDCGCVPSKSALTSKNPITLFSWLNSVWPWW